MKQLFRRIRNGIRRVSLVDWFLLAFMAALFSYTLHSLFLSPPEQEIGSVDVIVRTSSAAIFGYFLSRNSLQTSPSAPENTAVPPVLFPENGPTPTARAQIGFSLSSSTENPVPGGASSSESQKDGCANFQIIVVSCIGLFSLILLFLIHEGIAGSQSVTAAASQLRDFVSASVGFLVSCGKSSKAG